MKSDKLGSDVLPIEAVVFDFDGTLADTRAAIIATVEQTLTHLGVSLADHATITSLIGLPLAQTFEVMGVPAAALSDAVHFYRQCFFDNADQVVLFPEVDRVLRTLFDVPLPLGIASSRGRGPLKRLVEQLQLAGLFADVLGEEDVVQKKPAPELVHALARTLCVEPSRILVVGDTTYDIEMGNAAGARTCGITHGSHDAARLRSANPTWVIDSFVDLLEIVNAHA